MVELLLALIIFFVKKNIHPTDVPSHLIDAEVRFFLIGKMNVRALEYHAAIEQPVNTRRSRSRQC